MNQYISRETAVPYCYNYYYLSDHFFNFAEKSPHCSVIISNPRSIYGKGAVPLLVAIFYGATRDMVAVKKVEKGYQKLGLYHQFSLVEKKKFEFDGKHH